jgi:hypothetical protein
MSSKTSTKTANMLFRLPLCGSYFFFGQPVVHLSLKMHHRVMKARKTMKNQPLIQEVISQISQRFAPKIPDIKKVYTILVVRLKPSKLDSCRQLTPCWRRSTSSVLTAHEILLLMLLDHFTFF